MHFQFAVWLWGFRSTTNVWYPLGCLPPNVMMDHYVMRLCRKKTKKGEKKNKGEKKSFIFKIVGHSLIECLSTAKHGEEQACVSEREGTRVCLYSSFIISERQNNLYFDSTVNYWVKPGLHWVIFRQPFWC